MAAKHNAIDDAHRSKRRTISQYRMFADQAKTNAGRAIDDDSREWFLSLAKTMTRLADALQEQVLKSD